MGNDASKSLKRTLTRRGGGRGEIPDEYSAIDIREKYERMPKVGSQERMIIKSSWKTIKRNVIQKVNLWKYVCYFCFLNYQSIDT